MVNGYTIFILVSLLASFLISVLSSYLDIRSWKPHLPEEVADLYDPGKYRRAQEYNALRSRFHIFESSVQLSVLLIFWFLGGFQAVDEFVRNWGWSPLWTGVSYIFILLLANSLLDLPFAAYSTFVIEERFGFNRTTWRTFILDRIKALFLLIVLGIPLLAMILWFFQTTGENAWLYCWGIAGAFSIVVQFVAPVWIMPLFNKFTPLSEGELRDRIIQYANSVHFRFKDIFVIDGSRRTTRANAFFTGFGKNKRIAFFDTLLGNSSVPEVVAVLAHEIGHHKKKHVQKFMVISLLHLGLLFYVLSIFINNRGLFDAFYVQEVSDYAGLVFFGLLYEPISMILSVVFNFFSRKNELEADRFAVETTNDREFLVSALKKLHVQNLSNLTPHPLNVFLNYSHPPLLDRIHHIKSY